MRIEEVPDQKGNLTKTDNYRRIALSSLVSKTLNRKILNRQKTFVDPLLRYHQSGFRSQRSTTSHILALRRLLEGARDERLAAVMLFIDFKRALDSIMKILGAYVMPAKIVRLIEKMCENTSARMLTEYGLSEAFLILAGDM